MSKNWLITGTSTGFGRKMTELLLKRGDRVAATVRSPGPLDDLKASYGDMLWVGEVDVIDTAKLRAVVDQAFAALGTIDVAISNAGYGLFGAAEEYTDEQIERQIATNLTASIQFARAVVPHFRRQGSGHLMQVSSMGGQVAFPVISVYHATKWGIEGFYEALAQEIMPFGIKATLIEPGGARTNWGGSSGIFAEAMEIYEDTAVGKSRKSLQSTKGQTSKGDPLKMAQAIIDCADKGDAPLRLTLGSDAYGAIKHTLTGRLAALEAQKDIALSTDFTE